MSMPLFEQLPGHPERCQEFPGFGTLTKAAFSWAWLLVLIPPAVLDFERIAEFYSEQFFDICDT